jgi:hypothetical protein
MGRAGKTPPVRAPRRVVRGQPKRKTVPAQRTFWWLTADIEICTFCQQGYAYGTGYRCAGCDDAVCAFCIEIRSGEYWCPEC